MLGGGALWGAEPCQVGGHTEGKSGNVQMAFHVRLYPLCVTKIELFVYPPLVSVCVCHPRGWEGSMGSYDSTSLGSRAHQEGGRLNPGGGLFSWGQFCFHPL